MLESGREEGRGGEIGERRKGERREERGERREERGERREERGERREERGERREERGERREERGERREERRGEERREERREKKTMIWIRFHILNPHSHLSFLSRIKLNRKKRMFS